MASQTNMEVNMTFDESVFDERPTESEEEIAAGLMQVLNLWRPPTDADRAHLDTVVGEELECQNEMASDALEPPYPQKFQIRNVGAGRCMMLAEAVAQACAALAECGHYSIDTQKALTAAWECLADEAHVWMVEK